MSTKIKKLPTQKVIQALDLQELICLFYGAPGVGKTTFANELPKPNLFIATEDGQRALEAYVQKVTDWEQFLDVISLLESGDGEKFTSVTIDTVDNLFTFCEDYVCKKNKIEHMSDAEWGKGWKALEKEFRGAITRLQNTNIGVIFISHAQEVEIKRRSLKINKWKPTYGKQVRKIIDPLVDEMFFFFIEENIDKKTGDAVQLRKIGCHPAEMYDAKDRMDAFDEVCEMDASAMSKTFKDAIDSRIKNSSNHKTKQKPRKVKRKTSK